MNASLKRMAMALLAIATLGITCSHLSPVANAQDVVITIKKGEEGKTVTVKETGSNEAPFTGVRSSVDVAILLDTSSSMDGLIDQAKSQLWTLVQQFAKAEKNGKTPQLRVSVFEYGNSSLPASEDYIRQVVGLTTDLDKVSEALFSLKTGGGDEYCGAVIGESIKRLDWSKEPNSYKAIFIAGNEPFTQGPTEYQKACKSAIGNGIVVNTIHCGDYQTGVSTKWKDGADLTEGKYMNIDQDQKAVHIPSPHDDIIIRLGQDLNRTYLWYGDSKKRESLMKNQAMQDSNAMTMGTSSILQRSKAKSSKAYNYAQSDLLDAAEEDESIVEKLDAGALPEGMREMSIEERKAHVAKMSAERKSIQEQLAKANLERDKYVAEKRKEMSAAGQDKSLGAVMVEAVNDQLQAAGFDVTE